MIGPQPYANTVQAFLAVAKEDGVIGGLWRSTGVNAIRAAIYSGSQLATYETVKHLFLDMAFFKEEGPGLHFSASFVSGICAQLACHPADTLKTLAMEARGSPVSTYARLKSLIA